MRKLRYAIEAILAWGLFYALRLFPLDTASAIGGFLAKRFGPNLKVSGIARRNLNMALPDYSDAERERIILDMWENMGRVLGEYPHLCGSQMDDRCTYYISPETQAILEQHEKPALFIGGHYGNWEMAPKSVFAHGHPLMLIYRPANNARVDTLIRKTRLTFCADMHAKGVLGAREILRAIKRGQSIGMLIDQKMNDGMAIPFFGRDAMTAPAVAELALKYDLPIIPCRCVRKQGVSFDIYMDAPMRFHPSDNREDDVKQIMTQINALLEQWIREHPEQWFWVHSRWGKDV